ncbi:c-type cytochrome [Aquabacter spiritensis]|uniref:c-type cytochrome n=1 Tax=Aquabacter spiritensis TaxID=933073 RepID=UPI00140516EE|nr:c-type cytochrome [Aquabacter spiritensis]
MLGGGPGRAQSGGAAVWQPGAVRAEEVSRGRAVVVGAVGIGAPGGACFTCHGLQGAGDAAAVFPSLFGQSPEYLYRALRDYASGARENVVMSPIARALDDQQMRDVSIYFAVQIPVRAALRPTLDPERLQHGAHLAAVGSAARGIQGCVNCHGPAGRGLPPFYPALAGQHAAYIEAQLRAWKTGARKGDFLAVMESIARRMTEFDIEGVAAYYAALAPAAPGTATRDIRTLPPVPASAPPGGYGSPSR